MDIVKLGNDRYALRSSWFFGYKYADLNDLKEKPDYRHIDWWTEHHWWTSTESLEELIGLIENYDIEAVKQKIAENKQRRKDERKAEKLERKQQNKVTIVSRGVKFGQKPS